MKQIDKNNQWFVIHWQLGVINSFLTLFDSFPTITTNPPNRPHRRNSRSSKPLDNVCCSEAKWKEMSRSPFWYEGPHGCYIWLDCTNDGSSLKESVQFVIRIPLEYEISLPHPHWLNNNKKGILINNWLNCTDGGLKKRMKTSFITTWKKHDLLTGAWLQTLTPYGKLIRWKWGSHLHTLWSVSGKQIPMSARLESRVIEFKKLGTYFFYQPLSSIRHHKKWLQLQPPSLTFRK